MSDTFSKKLPDIKNGYVVFKKKNFLNNNFRQTSINSALIEYDNNEKIIDIFYTCQECLSEEISRENIFSIKPYIYRPIISEKGYFSAKRFYPIKFKNPFNFTSNFKEVEMTYFNLYIEKSTINTFNFENIYKDLSEEKSMRNLFFNLKYKIRERYYSLIIPLNYLNYPTKKSKEKYIQIIEGNFFIKNNNDLDLSYLAANINKDSIYAEINSNKPSSRFLFHIRKSKPKIFKEILNYLLSSIIPIETNIFSRGVKLETISYEFFKYVNYSSKE